MSDKSLPCNVQVIAQQPSQSSSFCQCFVSSFPSNHRVGGVIYVNTKNNPGLCRELALCSILSTSRHFCIPRQIHLLETGFILSLLDDQDSALVFASSEDCTFELVYDILPTELLLGNQMRSSSSFHNVSVFLAEIVNSLEAAGIVHVNAHFGDAIRFHPQTHLPLFVGLHECFRDIDEALVRFQEVVVTTAFDNRQSHIPLEIHVFCQLYKNRTISTKGSFGKDELEMLVEAYLLEFGKVQNIEPSLQEETCVFLLKEILMCHPRKMLHTIQHEAAPTWTAFSVTLEMFNLFPHAFPQKISAIHPIFTKRRSY